MQCTNALNKYKCTQEVQKSVSNSVQSPRTFSIVDDLVIVFVEEDPVALFLGWLLLLLLLRIAPDLTVPSLFGGGGCVDCLLGVALGAEDVARQVGEHCVADEADRLVGYQSSGEQTMGFVASV